MSKIKLLPCPFCGSDKLKMNKKSTLVAYNGIGERVEKWTYSVRCNSCHARGGTVGGKVVTFKLSDVDRKEFTSEEELKTKCAESWNNRKMLTGIEEKLTERMEEAAGYIEDDIFLGEHRAYKDALKIVRGGRE